MSAEKQVDFSIIVPCFNEVGAIADTVEELTGQADWPNNYELIIVDDGSSDGSAEILDRLALSHERLRVIHHENNLGYGAALKSGIRRARGPVIVITDADGTYPNHHIPELAGLCSEYDMVVGARIADDVQYSKVRSIPKFFLKHWVSWIARQPVPDINSGLRAFRKSTAESFLKILPDTFSFTTTITLAMLTTYRPVKFLPISYSARLGKSKIKPIRDTMRFSMLILRTGMYFAPVRLLSPFVAILGLLSVASLSYDVVVLKNLSDKTTLLFLSTFNTGMFALLADMIDKRSAR